MRGRTAKSDGADTSPLPGYGGQADPVGASFIWSGLVGGMSQRGIASNQWPQPARPETVGIAHALEGIARRHHEDDSARLRDGSALFAALYAYFRREKEQAR